jgi:hypothetical protein
MEPEFNPLRYVLQASLAFHQIIIERLPNDHQLITRLYATDYLINLEIEAQTSTPSNAEHKRTKDGGAPPPENLPLSTLSLQSQSRGDNLEGSLFVSSPVRETAMSKDARWNENKKRKAPELEPKALKKRKVEKPT